MTDNNDNPEIPAYATDAEVEILDSKSDGAWSIY